VHEQPAWMTAIDGGKLSKKGADARFQHGRTLHSCEGFDASHMAVFVCATGWMRPA
jgi:hypothetical protein